VACIGPSLHQVIAESQGAMRCLIWDHPEAKSFGNYCDLVPKLSASAGRVHCSPVVTQSRGPSGKQCNTYLKWAFIEAANVIVAHRHHPN
jgi:hypothetical protein